jgi:Domain of unknown function (DUF4340)
MSRQRFIVLLVAALAAICVALYTSGRRNVDSDSRGVNLLPSLTQELNSVSELSVTKGSKTAAVTVHKQGEQWTVAERANYPADVAKLRKLLLALSEARIREEKTSNPASYAIIGVEDPTLPGAAGAQIDFVAKDGKHAVIVGKPVGEGNFVRRAGEQRSYIVEPGIAVEAQPRYWIDTRLIDLPTAKIQSIEVKPAAGPGYTLHRAAAAASPAASNPAASPAAANKPAAGATAKNPTADSAAGAATDFVLDGVPAKRKAAESQILEPSPTAFGNLSADDVAQAADIDFSRPSVATVTLSDGSVITFTGAAVGDKRWIQVAEPKDAGISAKTNGRAFEIATYRYDAVFRPLEQLLVPLPPAPEKKPAPGAKLPAAHTTTPPKPAPNP